MTLAVAVSRLPFLGAGYGRDPDAWRVAMIARELLETGAYGPSRLPGYPVQEFSTALIVRAGPWAVNGMACLMSCVAAAAFAVWLRRLGVKHYLLVALGFACVPVVYVNSTSGMDYVWALSFALCAVAFATCERPLASGLCAGLAIGTRMTSGALLLPLALLIVPNLASWRQRVRAVLLLGVPAVAVGGLCYVPIFASYGTHFFPEPPRHGSADFESLWRATVEVWGLVGCVAVAGAAVAALVTVVRCRGRAQGKLESCSNERERRWVSAACATAILLYTLAYARMPLEAGYLVPVVPFAIVLLALWLTPSVRLVFACLLCLSPYVGSWSPGLRWPGPIFEDHATREAHLVRVEKIIRAAHELPPDSVVLAGHQLPQIVVTLGWGNPECDRFISLILNKAQYQKLKREHRAVYFVDRSTERYQRRAYAADLHALGARLLFSRD